MLPALLAGDHLENAATTASSSSLLSDRPDSLFKAEDFSTFTSSGDVLLDVCAADSPAQLMRDRSAKKVC